MRSQDENQIPFKKKHTLQQRIAKSKKQLQANPDKIVIIVERQKKANLPNLSNPSMIKSMLEKKIKDVGKIDMKGKHSFFLYIQGVMPNPESTMVQIYEKYKDEDGFLYVQYGDQESL